MTSVGEKKEGYVHLLEPRFDAYTRKATFFSKFRIITSFDWTTKEQGLLVLIFFWIFIDLSFRLKMVFEKLNSFFCLYLYSTCRSCSWCEIATCQVQIDFYWFVKVDLGDFWESTRPNRLLLIYLKNRPNRVNRVNPPNRLLCCPLFSVYRLVTQTRISLRLNLVYSTRKKDRQFSQEIKVEFLDKR